MRERTPLTLDGSEVHLWLVEPGAVEEPARLEALLAPEERRRQSEIFLPEVRRAYLVTRALVRSALSCFAATRPEDWSFASDAHGRPHLLCAGAPPPFQFSLSHTEGLVACLIGREPAIGVDVEDRRRTLPDLERLGARFSESEQADLAAQPPEARRERFLEYWTLKESFAKARGVGLSLPLDQFSLRLRAGEPIRIAFGPAIDDQPEAWQLAQLRPTGRHLLALAIRRDLGPEVAVRIHRGMP